MGKPNYKQAKEIAVKLLKENNITQPPIIASDLAKKSGLDVIRVRLNEIKPEYSTISGFIDAENNKMYVNACETPQRQNFTIAHELGHFLMNHVNTAEYGMLFRRPVEEQSNVPIEQEANVFAANLLVPEKMLKETIKKYPFISDVELGNLFGVSPSVIRNRKNYVRI